MAGRALAFADDEIAKLVNEHFVPVTGDDWYQRRRQDAEGEFFRAVTDQARPNVGSSTRQGIYAFTAGGKLLAWRNAGQNVQVMREMVRKAWREWQALPEDDRAPRTPGNDDTGEPRVDSRFVRPLPDGALVVEVNARAAIADDDGFRSCGLDEIGRRWGNSASLDHLWIMREEWQTFRTPDGSRARAVLQRLTRRLVRFHLIDNTRGEPPMWRSGEIRQSGVRLSVKSVTAARVVLWVNGRFEVANHANTDSATRRFAGHLAGEVELSLATGMPTRIELAARGLHRGEGRYTPGARPGDSPLVIAFMLVADPAAADRIPPQAVRDLHGYLRAD